MLDEDKMKLDFVLGLKPEDFFVSLQHADGVLFVVMLIVSVIKCRNFTGVPLLCGPIMMFSL